jgi:hypothetical protein
LLQPSYGPGECLDACLPHGFFLELRSARVAIKRDLRYPDRCRCLLDAGVLEQGDDHLLFPAVPAERRQFPLTLGNPDRSRSLFSRL